MSGGTERENAFLGPALFLVAACTAKGGIESPLVQRLLQGVGLHDLGVKLRAGGNRVDAARDAFGVRIHEQFHAVLLYDLIPVTDHVAKLPERVHVQQREGQLRRIERLHGEMQHHTGVFADGIQHHGIAKFRSDLADDADRFGFEALQMQRERTRCYSDGHESLQATSGNGTTEPLAINEGLRKLGLP